MPDKRRKLRRSSDRGVNTGLMELRKDFADHEKKDEKNFSAIHVSLDEIKATLLSMTVSDKQYVKDDTQWKFDNQKALDNMKNLTTSWKILLTLLGSIGIIAAGVAGFKSLFLPKL